jgi:bifunctional non-homologous end joining protein LigD
MASAGFSCVAGAIAAAALLFNSSTPLSAKDFIKAERDFPKAEWLKPELLAEVEYRRKTASGLLRHPSYKGMREDLGTKN